MTEKKLTGKIARERIRLLEVPRPPADVIAGFNALGDATGIVSDIMDELGITGVIPASLLKPTIAGASSARRSQSATSRSASTRMRQRAGTSIAWPSSRHTTSR